MQQLSELKHVDVIKITCSKQVSKWRRTIIYMSFKAFEAGSEGVSSC